METETLHCEVGDHDWVREKKRGAKPKKCPEHTIVREVLDREERIRRQQEGRAREQAIRDAEGLAEVVSWREWNVKDAALWAQYQQNLITHEEYAARKVPMPALPSKAGWKAAREAGLVADDAPPEMEEGDE